MTTYTMNGHRHPTMQVQPEIIRGIVANQVAQIARARRRWQAPPEKFRCLENPDPQVQLQEALKQIEALLQTNTQLLETVFLLSQALGDAYPLSHESISIYKLDRDTLLLSYGLNDGEDDALHGEIRMHTSK